MKLDRGEFQFGRAGDDLFNGCITEHANVAKRRGGHYRLCLLIVNGTRRTIDENQAAVDGARLPGDLRILRTSQAADLVLT